MTVPVAILAVLAAVAGLLQVPDVWHPFGDWLHTVAEPLVEPTVGQDLAASAMAVALGLAGIGIAWLLYGARRREVPRSAAAQNVLEHKFYFDELYDLVFYRPAVLISNLWRRGIEEPLIGGSISGVALGARRAGGALGEAQTGYLRSYALAIAVGAAVVVVVFLSVR